MWRVCVKANGRLGYSVRDVRSRAALATALLALLLSLAASAYAQDDAGMAAQQAAQQAMQATQQALQDMQLATATQQALQANDQAMQQAMQNALASAPSPLPRAAKPHFSPAAGKFASATLVSIQDGTPKAEIFYTLDGTEPTVFSDPYNGPILISSTIRLKAIARSPIYSPSRVASAKYVIK
jgi:type II secretory pathway pseudopilin PulG